MLYSSLIKKSNLPLATYCTDVARVGKMELKQTEGPVADDCTSTSKPWSSNVSPPAKDIHASYIPPQQKTVQEVAVLYWGNDLLRRKLN